LAPSHFEFTHAPAALLKGLPKHPVPSLLLARLAVTQAERGKGLGRFLLLDAFDRCLRVAREVSFRAIEVEAIDDLAAAFYEKHGFQPFPSNGRHLAIALETVEDVLGT
jgi:GNAT superfamily N-acetyltransferase